MVKTPFSEFLESQIYGENLKVPSSFFKDQHSNTPVLQYSCLLLASEPFSLTEREGPGFPYQNKWRGEFE
jgi:hypothetical protein